MQIMIYILGGKGCFSTPEISDFLWKLGVPFNVIIRTARLPNLFLTTAYHYSTDSFRSNNLVKRIRHCLAHDVPTPQNIEIRLIIYMAYLCLRYWIQEPTIILLSCLLVSFNCRFHADKKVHKIISIFQVTQSIHNIGHPQSDSFVRFTDQASLGIRMEILYLYSAVIGL